MSENRNFNDDLNDMLGNAREEAKRAGEQAKHSANEFSRGARDTFGPEAENKKLLAGILAILLGAFGIHKFILGYHKEGIIILIITLLLSILTCGVAGWLMSILGLIEGIIYLTKTDDEFYRTYQMGHRPWF